MLSSRPFVLCAFAAVALFAIACAGQRTADGSCSDREQPGDLSLATSAQGAASNYRSIDGSLTIEGVEAVELSLRCLEQVTGGISILHNPGLQRLSLPALRSVGGSILVMHSEQLRELDLGLLEEVGAELRVDHDPALEALDLAALMRVGGGLTLGHAAGLEQVHLPSLQHVGHGLRLQDNGSLTTLAAPALRSLGQRLRVVSNPSLTDLDLAVLETIGWDFEMEDNASLANLALPALASIGRGLQLRGNPALALVELASLASVTGSIKLAGNDLLEALRLPMLASSGHLELSGNASLATIELPGLSRLSGYLLISSPVLRSLSLPALESIERRLDLRENSSLEHASFSSLQSVGQGVLLIRNERLSELSFPALEAVEWSLDVIESSALEQLVLPRLRTLGRGLSVLHNHSLVALDAPTVETIGGDLLIRDNRALKRVQLSAVVTAGEGQVAIAENPLLPELSLPSLMMISGSLAVQHNAALRELAVPKLGEVGAYLSLRHNPQLRTLTVPSLQRIGRHLELRGLLGLSQRQASSLRALVVAPAPAQAPTLEEPASFAPTTRRSSPVAGAPAVGPPDLDQLRERNAEAQAHLDAGRFERARALAEQTLAEAGKDEESRDQLRDTRKILGRALDGLGRGGEAEQRLKLALDGEDSEHWNCAYQALGVLYSQGGGQRGEGSRPVDLSAPPQDDAQANFRAALRYSEAHHDADALKLVERALRLQPSAGYRVLRGFLLVSARRYDEARTLFEAVGSASPQAPGPAIGRGHLLVIEQDYAASRVSLERGLERLDRGRRGAPKDAGYYDFLERMAHLGLGWLHANQDQHETALVHFDAILEHRPDDLLANLGRGNSLMGLARMAAAEQQLARVLEIDPANPYARAELASIYLSRGQVEKAETGFRAALAAHDAGYTCPYEGLGLVYLRQGRIAEAQENFEKAISLNPDIEYKKFNGLARIYMQQDRLDEAEQLLRRSMRNFPHDGTAAAMLLELQQRRTGKAP